MTAAVREIVLVDCPDEVGLIHRITYQSLFLLLLCLYLQKLFVDLLIRWLCPQFQMQLA